MAKVIISVAVTGAIHTPSMSDYLPITPAEIAEQSIAAAEAGAAIIHLHARDPIDGRPTPDPAVFMQFLPVIKQSIAVLTTVGARVLGSQALGDQYGTLLAGAWHLQSSEVISEQRAEELLSASDWAPYQEELEIPDERRLLNRILQHQIRVEVDRSATNRTVLELVGTCHLQMDAENPTSPVPPATAAAVLARHGMKVAEGQLLVSNSAEALGKILADTAWGNNWAGVLLRLPKASKQPSQWFPGIGQSRAVALPVEGL